MKTYQVPTTKVLKPILYWQVTQNGLPIYRNNSVALCRHWMKVNGFLGAILKAIR